MLHVLRIIITCIFFSWAILASQASSIAVKPELVETDNSRASFGDSFDYLRFGSEFFTTLIAYNSESSSDKKIRESAKEVLDKACTLNDQAPDRPDQKAVHKALRIYAKPPLIQQKFILEHSMTKFIECLSKNSISINISSSDESERIIVLEDYFIIENFKTLLKQITTDYFHPKYQTVGINEEIKRYISILKSRIYDIPDNFFYDDSNADPSKDKDLKEFIQKLIDKNESFLFETHNPFKDWQQLSKNVKDSLIGTYKQFLKGTIEKDILSNPNDDPSFQTFLELPESKMAARNLFKAETPKPLSGQKEEKKLTGIINNLARLWKTIDASVQKSLNALYKDKLKSDLSASSFNPNTDSLLFKNFLVQNKTVQEMESKDPLKDWYKLKKEIQLNLLRRFNGYKYISALQNSLVNNDTNNSFINIQQIIDKVKDHFESSSKIDIRTCVDLNSLGLLSRDLKEIFDFDQLCSLINAVIEGIPVSKKLLTKAVHFTKFFPRSSKSEQQVFDKALHGLIALIFDFMDAQDDMLITACRPLVAYAAGELPHSMPDNATQFPSMLHIQFLNSIDSNNTTTLQPLLALSHGQLNEIHEGITRAISMNNTASLEILLKELHDYLEKHFEYKLQLCLEGKTRAREIKDLMKGFSLSSKNLSNLFLLASEECYSEILNESNEPQLPIKLLIKEVETLIEKNRASMLSGLRAILNECDKSVLLSEISNQLTFESFSALFDTIKNAAKEIPDFAIHPSAKKKGILALSSLSNINWLEEIVQLGIQLPIDELASILLNTVNSEVLEKALHQTIQLSEDTNLHTLIVNFLKLPISQRLSSKDSFESFSKRINCTQFGSALLKMMDNLVNKITSHDTNILNYFVWWKDDLPIIVKNIKFLEKEGLLRELNELGKILSFSERLLSGMGSQLSGSLHSALAVITKKIEIITDKEIKEKKIFETIDEAYRAAEEAKQEGALFALGLLKKSKEQSTSLIKSIHTKSDSIIDPALRMPLISLMLSLNSLPASQKNTLLLSMDHLDNNPQIDSLFQKDRRAFLLENFSQLGQTDKEAIFWWAIRYNDHAFLDILLKEDIGPLAISRQSKESALYAAMASAISSYINHRNEELSSDLSLIQKIISLFAPDKSIRETLFIWAATYWAKKQSEGLISDDESVKKECEEEAKKFAAIFTKLFGLPALERPVENALIAAKANMNCAINELDLKALIPECDSLKNTLCYAVKNNYKNLLTLLIRAYWDQQKLQESLGAVLDVTLITKNKDVIALLLDQPLEEKFMLRLLSWAAEANDCTIIESIFSSCDFSENFLDSSIKSLIESAIKHSNKLLIMHLIRCKWKNNDAIELLYKWAAAQGAHDLLVKLLEIEAPSKKTKEIIFDEAAKRDDHFLMSRFMTEAPNKALEWTVKWGELEAAKFLLDATDQFESTSLEKALLCAAKDGYTDIVEKLLAPELLNLIQPITVEDAFLDAAHGGQLATMQLLIKHIDLKSIDREGISLIARVKKNAGSENIRRFLNTLSFT